MDFILQLINLCLGDKILVCEKYMFNLYQKRKALILEFPLKDLLQMVKMFIVMCGEIGSFIKVSLQEEQKCFSINF